MRSRPHKIAAAAVLTFALLVSACSSGNETEAGADPAASGGDAVSDGSTDAATVAEANLDSLAGNDDVRLIEVLDVDTGEKTTLSDTVDGDRPVLLWFWAPH